MERDVGGALTRRTLAHEIVHACLAGMGEFPAWLHEGLAQKLSGETLPESRRAAIRAAAKAESIPTLANLAGSWSRMSMTNAGLAYAASLYAVELYYQHHSAYGIQNLLRNPDQLAPVMMDLDRRLRQ
jgi:hypothetical protein